MKRTNLSKLHWNVIAEDFNARKIVPYDVFTHGSFLADLRKAVKAYKDGVITLDEFLDKVRQSLVYFFWAKAEHEVLVDGLFDHDGSEQLKVDVYAQIKMNWDRFTEYLLANI